MVAMTNKYKKSYFITIAMLLLVSIVSCQSPKPSMEKFAWLPTECAPELYPANIVSASFILADGQKAPIMGTDPIKYGWGEHGTTAAIGDEQKSMPVKLEITWLSYTESKFYSGTFDLPTDKIAKLFEQGYIHPYTLKHTTYDSMVVGMAPGGVVVVWIQGTNNQVEIGRYQGRPSNITMAQFIEVKGYSRDMPQDLPLLVNSIMKDEPEANANLKAKGLQLGLWDTYREKFNLKPIVSFEQSHNAKVTELYLHFYNGEQEDLVAEALQKPDYVKRARVKNLRIKWTDDWAGKKQKYLLEIKFDETELFKAYKDVYGDDGAQPADLLIQINPGNNRCRILLQGKTKKVELVGGKRDIYLDE
jgi:Protein of unknown function (DUF2931)